MRRLTVIGVALALSGSAAGAGPETRLRIAVRADAGTAAVVRSLRCDPAAGTVAHPETACRRLLAAGRAVFAPTPAGTACSQIYGGPQRALVTGRLQGRPVWARFSRRDGCEVARWTRLGFLFAG